MVNLLEINFFEGPNINQDVYLVCNMGSPHYFDQETLDEYFFIGTEVITTK